ncbi:MAG: hypothetical protein II005_10480 [Turicibacter sp.]|nr:hypothetical protein [Turicibacter sp.]MBQ1787129.1 hypothetical protein [Turicibacter sp.]
MPTQDTIKLLNECNAGIKMAVESLDEVLDKAKNENLITILRNSLEEHKKLGDLTHQKLNEFHDKDKEPSALAKAMSWMSTNLKLFTGDVDEKIADLITEGCNMGIKSISRYLNQYPNSRDDVKDLVHELIKIEDKLVHELRSYL